ncbi:hypothetical protein ARMGADRAFT_1025472 [Armillaria gallica]|uniref:Uncharacterized protein n=1 Tax=Armillaria gallica TaxID=47427 RepID=A0A2H3ED46_ARMGA|nr:hypothetical protein ARMGADRAFT_1025472 [Armillaria gallica]
MGDGQLRLNKSPDIKWFAGEVPKNKKWPQKGTNLSATKSGQIFENGEIFEVTSWGIIMGPAYPSVKSRDFRGREHEVAFATSFKDRPSIHVVTACQPVWELLISQDDVSPSGEQCEKRIFAGLQGTKPKISDPNLAEPMYPPNFLTRNHAYVLNPSQHSWSLHGAPAMSNALGNFEVQILRSQRHAQVKKTNVIPCPITSHFSGFKSHARGLETASFRYSRPLEGFKFSLSRSHRTRRFCGSWGTKMPDDARGMQARAGWRWNIQHADTDAGRQGKSSAFTVFEVPAIDGGPSWASPNAAIFFCALLWGTWSVVMLVRIDYVIKEGLLGSEPPTPEFGRQMSGPKFQE